MKIIKNTEGKYFVAGRGFAATIPGEATRFSNEEVKANQECIAACGLGATMVEEVVVTSDPNIVQNTDGKSYAVSFVRQKQLRADGSINTHKLNPSKRRFASQAEADHHGARFRRIEKHLGYYVTVTSDPVNAYVNKVTGKTNPEIGKKRLNRD